MKRHVVRFAGLGALMLFACPAVGQQEPALPKPGPEHEMLAEMVGTWDCTVKTEGAPDSKATSVAKMELGGLWLATEFEGEFGGMPFQGKGLDTYDLEQKKYRSIWVDSFGTSPVLMMGDYDKATKTLTMTGEGPGPNGPATKYKSVTTHADKDHQTFKMFLVQGETETPMMTIEYVRRK